ncbi:hypothetical protein WJX79_007818 [Trebouxia sp. C0005]
MHQPCSIDKVPASRRESQQGVGSGRTSIKYRCHSQKLPQALNTTKLKEPEASSSNPGFQIRQTKHVSEVLTLSAAPASTNFDNGTAVHVQGPPASLSGSDADDGHASGKQLQEP